MAHDHTRRHDTRGLKRSCVVCVQTELLVNNAGFGAVGDFTLISFEKNMEMVQLNIVALTELTHLVVRRLLQEGKPRGRVMNISSGAGFVPGRPPH